MAQLPLELGKQVASIGVDSVYGKKQELGEITLIPVALSWSGFGAGEDGEGKAGGGGGGGMAVPIGAYVRKDDDVRFEPNIISLLAVGIPFVWVAGRALSRIIRALKK